MGRASVPAKQSSPSPSVGRASVPAEQSSLSLTVSGAGLRARRAGRLDALHAERPNPRIFPHLGPTLAWISQHILRLLDELLFVADHAIKVLILPNMANAPCHSLQSICRIRLQ